MGSLCRCANRNALCWLALVVISATNIIDSVSLFSRTLASTSPTNTVLDEAYLASGIQSENAMQSSVEGSWRHAELFGVGNTAEERFRRFPSTRERVMFYMSSWYAPPCPSSNSGIAYRKLRPSAQNETWYKFEGGIEHLPHGFYASDNPDVDTVFAMNPGKIAANLKDPTSRIAASYLNDLQESLIPIWNGTSVPLLIQLGDSPKSVFPKPPGVDFEQPVPGNPPVPFVSKAREATTWDAISPMPSSCGEFGARRGYYPRIIWKLNTERHYQNLHRVEKNDIPWTDKKDSAVFRGITSGKRILKQKGKLLAKDEQCKLHQRCQLVQQHVQSSLVDAKLVKYSVNKKNVYPEWYYGEKLSRRELLKYKALIMLQGNDVSSGLKWAMLSNSVVLMPKPTVSSWFMEELLQPFVHYVPIKDDLSDVEQQMQWILNHDREAQQIAKRGALWVKDMLFHEEAMSDEAAINLEILERYKNLFHPMVESSADM